MKSFTREHIEDYQNTVNYMESSAVNRDPIHKLFFEDKAEKNKGSVGGLIFERQAKKTEAAVMQQAQESKPLEQTPTEIPEKAINQAHNSLIETMLNKKRSQLSLAQFLHDKEVQA
jgi:hypothetical protein